MRARLLEIRKLPLVEALMLLQELVAYVMQTGPRGGRFYYTPKGRKVYRALKGKAPKEVGAEADAQFDREWSEKASMDGDFQDLSLGPAMRSLFGSKAPSPKEIEEMFGAPDLGLNVRIKRAERLFGGGVSITMTLKEMDGNRLEEEYTREFRRDAKGKPYAYHDFLEIREQYQGGGRAGAIFESTLKGYQKLGIKKVEVFAALSAGPYVWAKFGFQPKTGQQNRELEEGFRAFATRPVDEGGYGLTDTAVDAMLAKALTPEGDLDAFKLASMRIRGKTAEGKQVTAPVGKDFLLNGAQAGDGGPVGWRGMADLTDAKTKARWKRQAAKGVAKRKQMLEAGTATKPLTDEQLEKLKKQAELRKKRFSAPTEEMIRQVPRFGRASQQ
jgi:hypothetical protein